jgi:hypothetical protein
MLKWVCLMVENARHRPTNQIKFDFLQEDAWKV